MQDNNQLTNFVSSVFLYSVYVHTHTAQRHTQTEQQNTRTHTHTLRNYLLPCDVWCVILFLLLLRLHQHRTDWNGDDRTNEWTSEDETETQYVRIKMATTTSSATGVTSVTSIHAKIKREKKKERKKL